MQKHLSLFVEKVYERRKNFDMEIKSKSFRLVEEVADAFAEYCQRCGVIQERTVQALMVYAMTNCTAKTLGEMLDNVEIWLNSPNPPGHPADRTERDDAEQAAAPPDQTKQKRRKN